MARQSTTKEIAKISKDQKSSKTNPLYTHINMSNI